MKSQQPVHLICFTSGRQASSGGMVCVLSRLSAPSGQLSVIEIDYFSPGLFVNLQILKRLSLSEAPDTQTGDTGSLALSGLAQIGKCF
jgi:hypothetical protein